MDPTTEACGCMSTLIMGWGPLPFWPSRRLPMHMQTGKFSLTSRVGTLSLYSSRAKLLPLSLFLWVSGGKQSFNFTPLDKHQLSSPGIHLSSTSGLLGAPGDLRSSRGMWHLSKVLRGSSVLRRRKWQPTPVFLPGESHGQRSRGRLQSTGSQRVGRDWATSLSVFLGGFLRLSQPQLTSPFPLWSMHGHLLYIRCPVTGVSWLHLRTEVRRLGGRKETW